MKGIIGTPKTDIIDCDFYEDQMFVYHVIKEGKEIGRTVAKSPAGAIRNVAHKIHKKNPNIRYSEIKSGCDAVIFYEDIKEIRQTGKHVKIFWNWSNT